MSYIQDVIQVTNELSKKKKNASFLMISGEIDVN